MASFWLTVLAHLGALGHGAWPQMSAHSHSVHRQRN